MRGEKARGCRGVSGEEAFSLAPVAQDRVSSRGGSSIQRSLSSKRPSEARHVAKRTTNAEGGGQSFDGNLLLANARDSSPNHVIPRGSQPRPRGSCKVHAVERDDRGRSQGQWGPRCDESSDRISYHYTMATEDIDRGALEVAQWDRFRAILPDVPAGRHCVTLIIRDRPRGLTRCAVTDGMDAWVSLSTGAWRRTREVTAQLNAATRR